MKMKSHTAERELMRKAHARQPQAALFPPPPFLPGTLPAASTASHASHLTHAWLAPHLACTFCSAATRRAVNAASAALARSAMDLPVRGPLGMLGGLVPGAATAAQKIHAYYGGPKQPSCLQCQASWLGCSFEMPLSDTSSCAVLRCPQEEVCHRGPKASKHSRRSSSTVT